jgi:GNAT superfamily N-acetyltransferase
MALRRADVIRRLTDDEPRGSLALGALLRVTRPWVECRLLAAGPGNRSLCAVVRDEPGVWLAYPVLGHADDAADLGHAIDRSPALAVQGVAADVEPLHPYLRRVIDQRTLRRIVVPTPIDWEPPSSATRLASPLDIEALADLYDGYEVPFGRTRRAMVHFLRQAVERSWVVVAGDGPGGLDAAIVAVSRTPRFIEWSALTVRPAARGRRLSWALVSRAVALNNATGLGFVAIMGPRNPMTLPDGFGTIDAISEIDLWLPDRFRGERRLRRLWLSVDRTRQRRP